MMRAITIRQPWAELVVRGAKRIETRTWPIRYRGPLLVHAALTTADPALRRPSRAVSAALDAPPDAALLDLPALSYGTIIGQVDVIGCLPVEDLPDGDRRRRGVGTSGRTWLEEDLGDYGPGRYAWLLSGARRARRPVALRGRQGLFRAPAVELEAAR